MPTIKPLILTPVPSLLADNPGLLPLSRQLSAQYASKVLVSEQMLTSIGLQLWHALDSETAFTEAKQSAGMQPLPLVIASDDPAIQQLPWETLCHPQSGFFATSPRFTLSRAIPNQQPLPNADDNDQGPLRVLLFTALPEDPAVNSAFATAVQPGAGAGASASAEARLNIEEEQAQVLAALLPLIREGKVQLNMPDDGRFSSFCEEIEQFQPHLVFLSGHGSANSQHDPRNDQPAMASFAFEDEHGYPHSLTADKIADAFYSARVQCVVLSACESGKTSSARLNDGLVQHLANLGLPYVLGMRESVLESAGHIFAHYFCREIGKGRPVVNALQKARQAIAALTELPASFPAHLRQAAGAVEYTQSQWSQPLLVAQQTSHPLIDWQFNPSPTPYRQLSQSISNSNIILPERFIGRRAELRQLNRQIASGELRQLLLTGPGGQGKTALAGKIAQNQLVQGHPVYAYAARSHQTTMLEFATELQQQLKGQYRERYEQHAPGFTHEYAKAHQLLSLLIEQRRAEAPNGLIVLFFDNLEVLQNPGDHAIHQRQLAQWIDAAASLSQGSQGSQQDGLLLLLTSRWLLPDWPKASHWPLQRLSYLDFLRLAQEKALPLWLLEQPGKMQTLHHTLHGNGRGLQFFTAAIAEMNRQQAQAFEQSLQSASEQLQTNMALSTICAHLSADESTLLCRMTAYASPVPSDGVIKIALAAADKESTNSEVNAEVNAGVNAEVNAEVNAGVNAG